MFGGRELKNLELRRRELVLQSTINRLTMKVELQNLQNALHPAERIVSSIRTVRPWLLLLAPLAGIFAARGLRGNGSGFSKLIAFLKCLQQLLALWKQFGPPSANAEPETPPASTVPEARA
jgi:hypothetical protein